MATLNRAAAITGLVIVWGGTALLISPAFNPLGDSARLSTAVLGQIMLWVLAAATVSVVLFWEQQPLSSLCLQPFRWSSVAWGTLLFVVQLVVIFPMSEWLRLGLGLAGYAQGMEAVVRFPLWYRVVAVVGAGVVEEVLYRGFTVTRLATLTGRTWLAGAIAVVGFSAIHVPVWGWGFSVANVIAGAVATAFFIWRRDLLATIVCHTLGDAFGLLVAPAISDWWKADGFL